MTGHTAPWWAVRAKRCAICGRVKTASGFYPRYRAVDGLSDVCRACAKRKAEMSGKDIVCDGVLGTFQRPETPLTDTAQQFAYLFDHPTPKRKRRKRTLRDGDSLVSRARENQR